ncbi:hypothetical protein [Candidatus Manganitrophus noduliformans]|uniref:Uncharacterized protein n=1 Tax=Candidatus Manganitrophus noduliformans TaxID=2606439 RepID=A0A7X6DUK3_9BACT|nr:hypothetical protein [Candidatus Manganitrophus noduliformans]NKE73507.1 hypothetical protein [Candidatus Manganitrophus noduliformans]
MITFSNAWIKRTTVLFTLVYLFSTGFIMVRAEGHALDHEAHENHAKQHASFICTWMCAASSFSHTPEQAFDRKSTLSCEQPITRMAVFSGIQLLCADVIRPPPFLHA